MDNPIKLMMWANLKAMIRYMEFSQSMLKALFPVQAQQPKPVPVPATVAVKRRGCIGPADLRS